MLCCAVLTVLLYVLTKITKDMKKYYFKQSSEEIQALLDKLELLPTRAELDEMLWGKKDKEKPYFCGIEDSIQILGFFDGEKKVMVAIPDSDAGVFLDEHITYGDGMDEYALQLNSDAPNYGYPWNANGCKSADVGQNLNIPLPYVCTMRGTYGMQGEYPVESDFVIGKVIACLRIPGSSFVSKACEIIYRGHVIDGWWMIIPQSSNFETESDMIFIRNFLDEV